MIYNGCCGHIAVPSKELFKRHFWSYGQSTEHNKKVVLTEEAIKPKPQDITCGSTDYADSNWYTYYENKKKGEQLNGYKTKSSDSLLTLANWSH